MSAARRLLRGWRGVLASAVAFIVFAGVQAVAELERWEGVYYCSQGVTQMSLTVRSRTGDSVVAEFLFHAHPDNSYPVPTGCYLVEGALREGPDGVDLTPKEWVERPSDSWFMTPAKGTLDPDSREMTGWIDVLGCGGFRLRFVGDGPSNAPACRLNVS